MKTKLLLLALFIWFVTNGSSCVNDSFLVAVNLPISHCFAINAGNQLNFGGFTNIKLIEQIDPSYRDKMKGARYYDIRISTTGTLTNGTVVGEVFINDILLANYGGGANATTPAPWSTFSTPQSLLGSSPNIKTNALGVAELATVLNLMTTTNPLVTVKLSSTGTIGGVTTVPSGLSLCVEVLAQVDAEVTK